MATKPRIQFSADELVEHGFLTRDPLKHEGLLPEQNMGSGVSVVEIAVEYHTAKTDLMFCYICGRKNHNYGFIANINDTDCILIGNCFAGRIVNQALLKTARRRFDARKNRYHYTNQAREIIEQIDTIEQVCAEYKNICLSLDELKAAVESHVPRAFQALRSSIKQHGSRLISHEWRENPRYREDNRGPRYIPIPIDLGTMHGAAYLTGGRRFEIGLYEIDASLSSLKKVANDTRRSVDTERFVARFRNKVRERAVALDALIEDAVGFFATANLRAINAWFVHQTSDGIPDIGGRLEVERDVLGKLQKIVQGHDLSVPHATLTSRLSWGNYGGSNLVHRLTA